MKLIRVKKADNASDDLLDGMATFIDLSGSNRLLANCSEYELDLLRNTCKKAIYNSRIFLKFIENKINENKK